MMIGSLHFITIVTVIRISKNAVLPLRHRGCSVALTFVGKKENMVKIPLEPGTELKLCSFDCLR